MQIFIEILQDCDHRSALLCLFEASIMSSPLMIYALKGGAKVVRKKGRVNI